MNKITLLLFLIIYNLSFSQQKDYEVINTSVNSKFAELGATFLNNNTVVFASSKKVDDDKNFMKDRRKNNSQSFLEFYIGTITENGDILETGKFSNEIKNKFFEADITFSQDLKTVYFTWNNFYSIESKEDVEKWKTLRIVKATINENFETSNIVFLPFNSDKYSVRSPILSNNGKKLFFVSDMSGGYGESDIYYVDILNDGTYGTPVNLGPNINSAYSEQYPTIDANSNLYFSTIGNSGMGGLDIFKSEFKNGEYQKAQNLLEPINSKFDDFGFIYNSTTSTGYFTSNRKDGIGNVDIYAFVPKEIICAQEIVFNFIDEKTKKEISNVTISLTTNIENIEVLSDSNNSTYKTPLKCNTTYKLVAEKENYLPFETFITTNDILNKKIVETFKLTPLDCNQVVEVQINFEGKKEIIESGNVLIVDNKGSVITQPINDNHLISFKANCNTSYKIVANAKNYIQSEIEFTTDGTFNKQLKKEITLTKTPCFQKIAGTVKSIQKLPIIANVSLIVDGKLIEKQITDNFNFNVNCNTSYILLAEADNYNSTEILVKTGEALNTVNNISISLKPKLCNQNIEIIAFNKETNQQLKNSKISIYSNNNLLDEKYIINNNTLIFNADCNSNYKIIGASENFETTEIEFNTDDSFGSSTTKKLFLNPMVCNQSLNGNLVSESTNFELKNASVLLFSNGVLIEQKNVTDLNTFSFNLNCNTTYKIIASANNFENAEIAFETIKDNKVTIEKTITLTPKNCTQKFEIIAFNKETNEQLKNTKISIYSNNNLLDEKYIVNNNTLIFNADCNTNYKIIGASENFETTEIEFNTDDSFGSSTTKKLFLNPIECNQSLNGNLISESSNFELKNASVSLFSNGVLIEQKNVTDLNTFSFNLNCNTSYKIIASANNFENGEIAFETTKDNKVTIEKTIILTPKNCTQKIEIIAFNKETNEQLKNTKISIYSNNNLLDEKYIITNNAFIFNAACNTNYKIIGEAENFESNEIEFNTDATFNSTATKQLFLTPIICNQNLNGNLVSESNNFDIKNATVSLFSNNILIEQKEVTNLKNTFSFSLNCNTSYKIIASANNFENGEMVFETNADNDVIIEKTITLSAKKCKQKFEVIVFNKQTNQQLKNTKISIYSNNNLLDEKYIVNTNTLIFNAECNTNYKIISEAENFESDEIEFTTDLTYDASSTKQLFLTPKPCNQNLLISIFNKETKEPLFGSKLIVYKNNEILKTHSLLNDATFNLELSCDTNYNLKIELEKFDTQQFEFQTTNIYNSQLVKDIYLTPSIEYVTLGGQKLINTNTIYFDLDKDNITPDAAIELNKVISYLINNPEVKIEVKSHTDSRAPDNYNLKLSEGRAASVMSYIISKGIDASRVTGKGYGETQLINNCANGVKCTEAEHQLNRRTEFVIIE